MLLTPKQQKSPRKDRGEGMGGRDGGGGVGGNGPFVFSASGHNGNNNPPCWRQTKQCPTGTSR